MHPPIGLVGYKGPGENAAALGLVELGYAPVALAGPLKTAAKLCSPSADFARLFAFLRAPPRDFFARRLWPYYTCACVDGCTARSPPRARFELRFKMEGQQPAPPQLADLIVMQAAPSDTSQPMDPSDGDGDCLTCDSSIRKLLKCGGGSGSPSWLLYALVVVVVILVGYYIYKAQKGKKAKKVDALSRSNFISSGR